MKILSDGNCLGQSCFGRLRLLELCPKKGLTSPVLPRNARDFNPTESHEDEWRRLSGRMGIREFDGHLFTMFLTPCVTWSRPESWNNTISQKYQSKPNSWDWGTPCNPSSLSNSRQPSDSSQNTDRIKISHGPSKPSW
jgi:hypothetical protein